MAKVRTWHEFDRNVRSRGCSLLRRLDAFDNPILVAGCQRSGTTIVARVLTGCRGMVDYTWGHDDELDAALILAGVVPHEPRGRYCFQTTYINNCVGEYLKHEGFRMIWVIRNPHSVVYSMLHNWRRAALERLFKTCGSALLDDVGRQRYKRFGALGVSSLQKACLSYSAKSSQVFRLRAELGDERVMVVDYDDLAREREMWMERICDFVDLEYRDEYSRKIHTKSLGKRKAQSNKERRCVDELCMPIYERLRDLAVS